MSINMPVLEAKQERYESNALSARVGAEIPNRWVTPLVYRFLSKYDTFSLSLSTLNEKDPSPVRLGVSHVCV